MKVFKNVDTVMLAFGAFLVLSSLGFLFGCSKSETTASTTTVTSSFTSIYTNTLSSSSCKTCHQPGGSAWDDGIHTDFTSQSAAYRDLTTLSVQSGSNTSCASAKIVTASNTQKSYLLAILFDDYTSSNFGGVSGCTPTASHRQYGAALSSSEKTALVQWITNGAAND